MLQTQCSGAIPVSFAILPSIMTDSAFIIPVGTQVVTTVEVRTSAGEVLHPSGAVGLIVKAPTDSTHSYRVRFVDGFEAAFRGDQLTIRKHYQHSVAIGPTRKQKSTCRNVSFSVASSVRAPMAWRKTRQILTGAASICRRPICNGHCSVFRSNLKITRLRNATGNCRSS